MKFMMMHKHDAKTEAGEKPPASLVAQMGELIGGMAMSGKLSDGAGLGATATRSRVTLKGGERRVVHGPFSESTNQLPAGYIMVKVGSRDEAIAWATKVGTAIGGDVQLDVGRVNEPWDIGIGEKPANAPEKYLILNQSTAATESGRLPNLAAVKKEMADRGVLMTHAALTPSSQAKRIKWRAGTKQISDGPFAESKELIGGYAVLDFASVEECLELCWKYAAILLAVGDTLEIDIRPVAE